MRLSEIIDLLNSNDPDDLLRADREADSYHDEIFKSEDDAKRYPTLDGLLVDLRGIANERRRRLLNSDTDD